MKNIFSLFVGIMIVGVSYAKTANSTKLAGSVFQDTLVTFLASMDFDTFKSKPVDSFIVKIPQNYVSMKVYGSSRADIAGMLIIEYPNNVFIEIHVWEFAHMNPENPNKLPPAQAWSVALFKKEKVGYIKAFNGSDCINGCENR